MIENKKNEIPENKTSRNPMMSFLNLWPAILVAGVAAITIPMTAPILPDIPEKLAEAVKEAAGPEEVQAGEVPEDSEVPEQATGNYEDGVYTGSARGYGGTVSVQVTVEDHQITKIDILSAANETSSFFNRAKAVIEDVLLKQSWEVDVVSGATYSSNGILGAVKNALTGETVVNEKPASSSGTSKKTESVAFTAADGYKDGTYYGSAQGFGGQIKVSVTIKDGKISDVSIISASGETSSYFNKAKKLTSRIVSAQSPNVDVVSGATYSSNGILNAAKKALNQAAVNSSSADTEDEETDSSQTYVDQPVIIPTNFTAKPKQTLVDGVYTGTAEGFGGDVVMQVTVKDGCITDLQVVSAEDETPTFFAQAKSLIPQIVEQQTADVDVVSGATYSSNGIKGAVKDALAQAQPADTDTPSEEEQETEDPEADNTEEPTTEEEDTQTPEEDSEKTDETPSGSDDTGKPVIGQYADGTYQESVTVEPIYDDFGYSDFDEYTLIVNVTFKNDNITEITYDESNTYDNLKLNQKRSEYALNGYSGDVGLGVSICKKQSTDVDTVSSATCSSESIKKAVEKAMEDASQKAEELKKEQEEAEQTDSGDTTGESGSTDPDGTAGGEIAQEETTTEKGDDEAEGSGSADSSDALEEEDEADEAGEALNAEEAASADDDNSDSEEEDTKKQELLGDCLPKEQEQGET